MRLVRVCLALLLLTASTVAVSAESQNTLLDQVLIDTASDSEVAGYVARIALNDPAEVGAALMRAEQLYLSGDLTLNVPPVAMVLHGPELVIFLKENYDKYKSIVDLAARLSAFNVVDVKVCENRMSLLGVENKSLHPFVGTVNFGPAEIDRLLTEEGYDYF